MSVSVNEFWNRIATSGIADTNECRAMAVSFAKAHEGSPPADAHSLAKHLVETKRLTAYQAKVLLAKDLPSGDRGTLRIGKFLVSQPVSQSPFQGWYWAEPEGSEPPALLYPLGPHSEIERRWLLSHQAVEAAHLQPVTVRGANRSADTAEESFVVSRLPAGQSLSELLRQKKRFDDATVRRIGLAVGRALQSLHEKNITHGAVHPERIWMGNDRSVWLLRDATGPATTPYENRPGWFRPLEVPALCAAPEFSLPGQMADPLTDQYALGCLLWHLRTGMPPFAAADTDRLIHQHTTVTPEPLRQAVRAGASGDPLLRVVAHAMSKNAKGRFPQIASLIAAIEAVDANVSTPPAKRVLPPSVSPAEPQTTASAPAVKTQKPQAQETAVAVPMPLSAADAKPLTQAATPAKPLARRRKKNKKAPLMIGGLGFLVMVLLVLVLVTRNGGGPAEVDTPDPPRVAYEPPPKNGDPVSNEPVAPASDDLGGYQLVNDQDALWLPPSSGEAPALRLIPPGPQMVVRLRLRHLLTTPTGQEMLAAIDRELGDAWSRLEARTGVPAVQIERLTVALEGAGDGNPAAAFGVELAAPVPLRQLQEQWNAEPARTPEGVTIFAGEVPDADAYFVAGDSFEADTAVDAFAVGSLDQIKLVAEIEGGPIPLPRSLEQLWQSADADADIVVLGTPNFLFADGRQMLAQYASEAVEPLKNFLLPDVAGLMLTSTLEPQWYLEVRLAPGSGTSAAGLVQELESSVKQLPQWAEQFLIETSPDASWKALALRLPQMMFAVSDHARFGVSNDHAVGNLYLPQVAAPNVSLATLLAVNTPAGPAIPSAPQTSGQPPLTLDQMLERPMSIRFDQEGLDMAAKAILDEFAGNLPRGTETPKIVVLGKDLELEGITQNQQIRDFDFTDAKLRTVLTELVLRGNPVTTVQSPTEEDQKLVWVVGPHPDSPEEQAILITTRTAAADRYALPSEFVAEQ